MLFVNNLKKKLTLCDFPVPLLYDKSFSEEGRWSRRGVAGDM
jgi:hypothetical protein